MSGADLLADPVRRAVVTTLPLYEMARMRAATTPRRHPERGFAGDGPATTLRWVNQFTHTRRLLGPRDREVVTPNNDTLYSNAWLDLAAGPLVIDVPAMGERYWTLGFLDMWTNPFAYAGRRTTGNAAQRIFVHGPAWIGTVPEGMQRIAAPGDDVWIIGRILVDDDEADLAAVRALQDRFAIHRADGTPALSRFDAAIDGRKTDTPDAGEYVRTVDAALARNPAPRGVAGWPPPHDALALTQALADVCAQLRDDAQPSAVGGGWCLPVTVRTDYGDDILTRARVARNFIGALGIDEAMYVMAEVDADGRPLDGRQRYELRFAPGAAPQVDAFWSLTLYRRADCLLVDNPIDRYSIGDRSRGLRTDADGGLRIRIQADDPGAGENWLPAPREAFYLTLRLYQPRSAHLDLRFDYPPVTRLD